MFDLSTGDEHPNQIRFKPTFYLFELYDVLAAAQLRQWIAEMQQPAVI